MNPLMQALQQPSAQRSSSSGLRFCAAETPRRAQLTRAHAGAQGNNVQAIPGVPDAAVSRLYKQLLRSSGVETSLELRRGAGTRDGLGLAATTPATKGSVLLRVPRSLAITIDYAKGMSMPQANWPRLRGGAARSGDPLPWDILQALALIDGLAGDGGEFWQAYADALLPAPEALCLPMCWEAPRLAQLQHADIAAAANRQQERLKGLLPELMEPLAPDVPSWLQWAFACVRSRAFRAGPDAFAFVPFLDLANHADAPSDTAAPATPASSSAASSPSPAASTSGRPAAQPPSSAAAGAASTLGKPTANADFRLSLPPGVSANQSVSASVSDAGGSGAAGDAGAGAVGEWYELVALRDVEPGEEVTICYSGPEGYTNQRFMAQYGFVPRGGNPADRVKLELGPELQAAPLCLARLQDLMGDTLFLGAMRGDSPYVYAALKSLPLADGPEPGPGRAAVSAGVATAAALLRQVDAQVAEGTTSLEADLEALDGSGGAALREADPRAAAALAYRIERKRLLETTQALLRAYTKGARKP